MSDTVQLAIVAGIITVATLIIKGIIDRHARKVEIAAATAVAAAKAAADEAASKVSQKMEAIEIKIDGRLTQLLELTQKSYKAEGVIEGKAEEKAKHQGPIETHPLPVAGTTNLKIVEGEIKVKPGAKK